MKVAGLVLMLVNVRLSLSCDGEGQILFCTEIPPAFRPGYSSLVMFLRDVGEINSTAFRSDDLTSVTRLRIDNAGVTGVAEGAFSSFQNLTSVSLNQNLLTEINPGWFGRPDLLSELSLTENLIEVVNESMLNGLTNLSRLTLSNNRIRTIDPNSFSSHTVLAELDLSGNRMTRVSPQVFRSLRSTRIRLDGNPWDCSCGAEDFVDFLKDLHSRSGLDRPMQVTCESPSSLRGRPAWNVSVCVTSSPPRPPSATQTVHPRPTGVLTAVSPSTSAKVVTTPSSPSSRPSEKNPSVQPKPTDAPINTSSHTGGTATPPARPPSETNPSVQPKPSDTPSTLTAATLKTFASHGTRPPSVTEISVRPKPSDLPRTITTPAGMTETCVTSQPLSNTNMMWTLVVVIVVLSSLLFVACFLAVLHRRKRISKTVMPVSPEENRNELKEDGRSSRAQSPENNPWDSEMGWKRSFTGVRAKSANAILFTFPFCAPVKDHFTLQSETEAQSKDTENQAEGRHRLGDETQVGGGIETENLTNTSDVIKNYKKSDAGINVDGSSHHVSVTADTVPYLSIGTNQNKPRPDDFNKQPTDASGQGSRTRKVLGRISTWPPTAAQWQARCKMKEEEGEEGSEAFTVWTPKFPGEVKKEENPSGSDRDKMEDLGTAPNQDPLKMSEAHMKLGHSQSSKRNDKTSSVSEPLSHTDTRLEEQLNKEEMIQDPANVRQTQILNQEKLGPNQDLKSAEKPAPKNAKKNSGKAEPRSEPKRAGTSRRGAENTSKGSNAPSGGASPDDETLLSGNEYAFVDLLHEVVQNNGRWTRERWRQIHVNKQRHQDRGTKEV